LSYQATIEKQNYCKSHACSSWNPNPKPWAFPSLGFLTSRALKFVSIWRPKYIWIGLQLTRALGYRLNVTVECELSLAKRIHPSIECDTSCPTNTPRACSLYFTHSLMHAWGTCKDWQWALCLSKKKKYPWICKQSGCNTTMMIPSATKCNTLEERNLPRWQQQITTRDTVITVQDNLSTTTKRRGEKRRKEGGCSNGQIDRGSLPAHINFGWNLNWYRLN
jgi:hypothetical protein